MIPHYSLTTPPDTEPISLADLSDHCRVDSADDAVYLDALIGVAREYVDGVTGRAAAESTWTVTAESWGALTGSCDSSVAKLYRTPLASVSSVKYYASGEEVQATMDESDYRVVTGYEPGMIQFTGTLPSLESRPDAVEIEFVAGYAEGSAPAILRHAIKMLAAHLYENRIPVNIGNIVSEIPYTLRNLLENQKLGGWSA